VGGKWAACEGIQTGRAMSCGLKDEERERGEERVEVGRLVGWAE
jgi:hypothetical protein